MGLYNIDFHGLGLSLRFEVVEFMIWLGWVGVNFGLVGVDFGLTGCGFSLGCCGFREFWFWMCLAGCCFWVWYNIDFNGLGLGVCLVFGVGWVWMGLGGFW